MTYSINPMRRVSRRETLKLCLVPAGALASGWLLGCSNEEPKRAPQDAIPPAMPPQTGTTPITGTAGANPPSTPSVPANDAMAGTSAQPAAGASAPAGASGAPAMSAGGMGGAMDPSAGAAGMDPPRMAGSGPTMAGSGGTVAAPGTPWAQGGTKSMMGGYPDPFAMGMGGTACMLYPSQTLGPCYAQMPGTREDISDGMIGLPVRLSFLVVRDGCTPVSDATVDIWHSGVDGIYSAFAMGSICNPGTMNVRSDMFCRGVRRTDQAGRADFNTIFPGWYAGRAVHIHFTVRVGGRAEVTSQLYFDDTLVTEIQAQGEYKARGMRDTLNTADRTFRSGGATPDAVTMSTVKRPDGVLHAWKVLALG